MAVSHIIIIFAPSNNKIHTITMKIKMKHLIEDVTKGNRLCNGKRQAWVECTQYKEFERECEVQGINVVKTFEFKEVKGNKTTFFRWYFNASETITYYNGYERVEVPIGKAVNKKNCYQFFKRVTINGRQFTR